MRTRREKTSDFVFNGCTQTTICTSFKDHHQGTIASYHRDNL
jgi:hypothetical protein